VNVAKESGLSDREEEFADKADSSERIGSLRGRMMREVVQNISEKFGGKGGERSGRKGRKRGGKN